MTTAYPMTRPATNQETLGQPLLLATDLDGTFLAGTAEERLRLYQLIDRYEDVKLAYVTGRGLEAVLPLLSDPMLPRPDYIICDVGATVVEGRNRQPVQPLQSEIDARWPGEQAVSAIIDNFEGLQRQEVPQERRCSYYCEEGAIDEPLIRAVEDLGCDLLYSADRYLDVLPRGTNKGDTLRKLVEHIGIDDSYVLVAGDTLNDLSMYGVGFKGVCVGASESRLLDATRDSEHTLHAEKEGCGGILEAMVKFGLLPNDNTWGDAEVAKTPGKAELVIVYHRLPYEEFVEDGNISRRPPRSPNGIIPTLLSFFADGRRGSWVAWTIDTPKSGAATEPVAVDRNRYPHLTAARVPLSKQDVDIFYKRFSKEAFWPLLHTFWERARFREDHWQVFLRINRAFAERTATEAARGATAWIHDYNLWMVPAYLRELRPDVKIAFFHHTYFPSADVFNVVPWRRTIVGSLLACDYVGFHIPRQVENFVDVVRGAAPVNVLKRENCAPRFLTYGCAVGLDRMTTCIEVNGRQVALGAHPVGLDVGRVRHLLNTPAARSRIESLRKELDGQRLILSVERLDYTKGTLEKLLAYELLLEQQPELHGKVTMIAICVPAAREMTIYKQLQTQIEQVVGRINGRHSRVGWVPLQFFFRGFPFEELIPYYATADIMWVTPLRDGLNLIAKEFVAVQGMLRGYGVLVLSEFAGAAAELKGAILTNPHDISDLTARCLQAIRMPRTEARGRLRQLFEIVRHHDVAQWGDGFLEAIDAAVAHQNESTSSTVAAASTQPA